MSAKQFIDDCRTWLLAPGNIAGLVDQRCHYLAVPQGYAGTYLWYQRQAGGGDDDDRCLDDLPGSDLAFRELVNVEAISRELAEAEALALEVRKLDSWNKWSGPFGAGTVQAVFVRDHSDQYEPMGTGGDTGLAVGALQLEIVGYQPGD